MSAQKEFEDFLDSVVDNGSYMMRLSHNTKKALELIDRGADVNTQRAGWALVHFAAQTNNILLLEELKKRKANFSLVNDEGLSPISLTKHPKIIEFLQNTVQEECKNLGPNYNNQDDGVANICISNFVSPCVELDISGKQVNVSATNVVVDNFNLNYSARESNFCLSNIVSKEKISIKTRKNPGESILTTATFSDIKKGVHDSIGSFNFDDAEDVKAFHSLPGPSQKK